jgi:hypothetical protein
MFLLFAPNSISGKARLPASFTAARVLSLVSVRHESTIAFFDLRG